MASTSTRSRTSSAPSTSRSSTRWRCWPTAWGSTSGRSSTPRRPSPTASCASSPGPAWAATACPVDPFYLTWKAREYDLSTEFIELAGKVNQQMPYFCLEKIERALNDDGRPVRGSRVLVLGVAYKAGVGDLRESPALKILRLLRERGGEVAYHDPHVPELPTSACAASRSTRRCPADRPRGDRHRAPGGRPRRRRARAPRRCSTCAASRGGSRPPTCASSRRPPRPPPCGPRAGSRG